LEGVMGKRLDRTILNWKWWVVLPATPIIAAVVLLKPLLDAADRACLAAMQWARPDMQRRAK